MGVTLETWRQRIGLVGCRSHRNQKAGVKEYLEPIDGNLFSIISSLIILLISAHSRISAIGVSMVFQWRILCRDRANSMLSFLAFTVISILLIIGGIEQNPGPYPCKLCPLVPETIASCVRHQHFHGNDHNFKYFCPASNCSYASHSFSGLNKHVSLFHRSETHQDSSPSQTFVSCMHCEFQSSTLWDLVQHLYKHLDNNETVSCPVESCSFEKTFSKKSTFRVHLSQYHKDWRAEGCPQQRWKVPEEKDKPEELDHVFHDEFDHTSTMDFEDSVPEQNIDHLELQNDEVIIDSIAKFYLHLYAQNLLPFDTIQEICESLTYLTDLVHARIKLVLSSELRKLSISEHQINSVCYKVLCADLLYTTHHKDIPGPSLTSDHLRQKYFMKNFSYEPPTELNLNPKDPSSGQILQYVSIQSTLSTLLKDTSVQEEIDKSFERQQDDANVISDYTDGSQFKSEEHNSKEIRLFLYQDSFNPVMNALGSAKNKYKMLAMYFTVGNFLPHLRAKIDTKHLVLLVRESVFKALGATKCFAEVIKELLLLERDGILYKNEYVKVVVQYILGDSLGQHLIGGFLECFSAIYFCRYCLIKRIQFKADPLMVAPGRSVDNYTQFLFRAKLTGKPFKGIKGNCEFNCLKNVHAATHLVPCIAHDLNEGVISWDLSGILSHFIQKKKWFTYKILNARIKNFKCNGEDIPNKPAYVKSNGKKLGGHAIQNLTLLRILPFLIGDKIKDYKDPGWLLFLKLKELCEFFFAPSLLKSDVPYIKDVLLPAYFELRQEVLDKEKYPVRPKHHYMSHYPELILRYGPLLYLWTLSYEQKHKFFKTLMRVTRNFINPEYTCAVRHQMNLAYLSTGPLFPKECFETQSKTLNTGSYSGRLASFLSTYALPHNSRECSTACLNGLMYHKEDMLLLSSEGIHITAGIIKVIIPINDSIIFILEKFKATFNSSVGLYMLPLDASGEITAISAEDLRYPKTHPTYIYKESISFSLKHRLLINEE